MSGSTEAKDALVGLTADVVAAYVSNNPVPASELPFLIGRVHAALQGSGSNTETEAPPPRKPAVPVKKSVMPDYIVCLEDGKKFKSLKRHLAAYHDLSPEEYRAKWGLPADYPMTAPNYSAFRAAAAKAHGLGSKRNTPAKAPAPQPAKKAPARKVNGPG
jgi:predicted transcriptional regulator